MKSKMCPILNEIADHFLDMDTPDGEGKMPSYNYSFDESDVMNASLIFNHVMSNIYAKKEKANVQGATDLGRRLHELVKDYTGVDTQKFYG